MSENNKTELGTRSVAYRYPSEIHVHRDKDSIRLPLPCDGNRQGLSGQLSITNPSLVRDSLLTMADILASDHRFKPTDRSDYLAYLLKQGQRARIKCFLR